MPKLEVDKTLDRLAKKGADGKVLKGADGKVIYESPQTQALRILEHLKKQLEVDANKKIGIIYAANDSQSVDLLKALANKLLPEGAISGSGQAPVFAELMKLINKDPVCRGRIKILPVSTSLTGGENKPGNIVSNEIIRRDLKVIQRQLQEGYDVFAMPSGQKQGYFAIGGLASKHWFTTDHAAFLYKGRLYSQGDFVQMQLNALKQDPTINLDTIFNEAKLLTGKEIAKAKAKLPAVEMTDAAQMKQKGEIAQEPQAQVPPKPQVQEPPKPQAQEPPKPQAQEPPKPQVQEPPKPQAQEPPKPQVQVPPKPQVQEPPKPQVQVPPKPQVQEPPKPQAQEPPKPQAQEPPKPQVQEPPKPQVQEPPKPQVQVPPNPQVQEPPKPQVQVPPKPQVQEPPKPQAQEPPKPQAQEPPKPQAQEPPKPQVQEPPKPQVQEPPKPQAQEPPKPQVQEPPKPQQQVAKAPVITPAANSHQKMHLIMNASPPPKLATQELLLAQNFKLNPNQITAVGDKNGSIEMKVQFSDQAAARIFSKQLALYGITSNSNPGKLKTVTNGVVYLTAKDINQFEEQQKNRPALMKKMAIECLNVSTNMLGTSMDKNNPAQTNLAISFASKEEAELMSKRLFKMGVESNTNPGSPKLVTHNKIILTLKDAAIIQHHHQTMMTQLSLLKDDIDNLKSIKPSVDKKTGDTNFVMSFANKEDAEQMSKYLVNMGVTSLTNAGMAKSVHKNNEIILSQKQGELVHQQFKAIKHEKEFLQDLIHMDVTIVPSINKDRGQTNLLAVFKNDQDAENFTKKLAAMGLESTSNPGQPKSIQPGHGVILTPKDCEKLEQALVTMRPSNKN